MVVSLFLITVLLQVCVFQIASRRFQQMRAFLGKSVVLYCPEDVSGTATWQRWAKELRHTSTEKYKISKEKFQLTINNTTMLDAGQYCCEYIFESRPIQSCFDLQIFVKPTVKINIPPDELFYKGGIVTISCSCDCDPVSITWMKSNMILSYERNLRLTNLSNSHVGTYLCVVKNEIGSITAEVKVAIKYPPDIPQNITVKPYRSGFREDWTPNYNGGLAQSFYILYSHDSNQHIQTRISEGPIVNTTVIEVLNLEPNTIYRVAMYASNALGNSSVSNVIKVLTKHKDEIIQQRLVLNYVLFTIVASLFFFSITTVYTILTNIMNRRSREKKLNIHVQI